MLDNTSTTETVTQPPVQNTFKIPGDVYEVLRTKAFTERTSQQAIVVDALRSYLDVPEPITVEAPPMPVSLSMQPVAQTAPKIAPAADKSVPAREAPPLAKQRNADGERLTIRQRILNAMKERPMGSADVVRLLKTDGINADIGNAGQHMYLLAGQHMYLLARDGFAVRNDDSGTWSITEAGRNR
jgi:hypothetical protein